MAYRIDRRDGFFEVSVSGETSKVEILKIIRELDRRDRGKKLPDLWHVAKESQVPFAHFRDIVQTTLGLLPRDAVANRTAIVAADEFQKAQFDLYRSEAAVLPFDIRVFRSRDEAVKWLEC